MQLFQNCRHFSWMFKMWNMNDLLWCLMFVLLSLLYSMFQCRITISIQLDIKMCHTFMSIQIHTQHWMFLFIIGVKRVTKHMIRCVGFMVQYGLVRFGTVLHGSKHRLNKCLNIVFNEECINRSTIYGKIKSHSSALNKIVPKMFSRWVYYLSTWNKSVTGLFISSFL